MFSAVLANLAHILLWRVLHLTYHCVEVFSVEQHDEFYQHLLKIKREQAISKIKQSLECNEYICTQSSGQTIVLYHRKVAWNNFSVYLIYDTAFLKSRLEQACELQSEAISGERFILLRIWHTVAVTLSRVAMSGFGKFIHTLMTGDHMSLTAKNVTGRGVLPKFNFPSSLSCMHCTPPY